MKKLLLPCFLLLSLSGTANAASHGPIWIPFVGTATWCSGDDPFFQFDTARAFFDHYLN